MLMKLRIAQSTAEYAILLSLVVAAALGIQNEVRRAIQARIHQAAMVFSNNQEYESETRIKTTTEQKQNRVKTENPNEDAQENHITITDNISNKWGEIKFQ
ncbi:MAG: hypothetical protein PHP17_08130 [Candidatus Omnitrophica bacterium]|nr:hypothetical protein [Candidatus Omnitrophota bacterium]